VDVTHAMYMGDV